VLTGADHAVVQAGMGAMFSNASDMAVVGDASDGHEAVAQHAELRPDTR
jgi:DNA-binding NarL/FixJ family response regulator